MERPQDEWLHSEVPETSGSRPKVLPRFIPELGPSHSDSTPIGISSTTSQPSVESPPPLPTSLAGLSGLSSSSPSTFLSNKGAMIGLFAGLGVLILSILGIVYLGWIRRRRYSKQQESRTNASVTFSTLMRRFDANPTNRGSEPRQTFFMQQTIPRSAPSDRVSVPNVSEWLARRRERRSSQIHQIVYHSRPPSVIDEDTKHFGEGTQWTLGNVLENQRQQVIKPRSPVPRPPIKRPKPGRSIPRALSPRSARVRRSVAESEGGQFTLEDALLPSLASSPTAYELGSSRSGRHPYAHA